MKRFDDLDAWRRHRAGLEPGQGASLGFVPTMGALHEGHHSLVDASVAANDLTVVSVFVNPTQFDQVSDLEAYPRDLDRDLERLADWGADAVLLPTYETIYPDGYRYRVQERELSRTLCGAHRDGHFDGVLTVVLKLFQLVRPTRAYFGEKDWQQLQLVRGMVEAFFLDLEIVPCPIVREEDGLALSSRNQRLDPAHRQRAPRLYQVLRAADSAQGARRRLAEEGFEVDYVEDLAGADGAGRRLAAVRLGEVRLIDNVALATIDGVSGETTALKVAS